MHWKFCLRLVSICSFRQGFSNRTFNDWFQEAKKVSVGYVPPITRPPTEMKVIFSIINWSLDVITELILKNIILEIDQAIHTKVLDAMLKMELDRSVIFDKIIPRMGGFQIVISMLKTIFSRFKDSGIIYLFMCLFYFF